MQKKLPMLQMRAEFTPGSYNPETRTIDLTWTTGARGLRSSWFDTFYEELDVSPEAVRMDRLNNGAPFLAAHNQRSLDSVLGVVERAWLDGGVGHATVRFTNREDAQGTVQDIVDGVIRNISVGYRVWTYREVESGADKIPVYRATDWEPMELSAVPIGFDDGAKTRDAEAAGLYEVNFITREAMPPTTAVPGVPTEEKRTMGDENTTGAGTTAPNPTTPAPAPAAEQRNAPDVQQAIAAERTRVSEITTLVRSANLPGEIAERLIADGATLDQARATVIDKMIENSPTRGISGVTVTRDERETMRRGIESAILLRVDSGYHLDKEDAEIARNFRHMSMLRLAEETLGAQGVSVRGLTKLEIATRALNSTSDFPLLLANVANKRLRSVYENAPTTYQVWARRAPNAPDFKTLHVLQVGAAPNLELVPEGAEYKYGTFGEGQETYSIATYGKIIALSRAAIVNDDLRAFDRVITGFGAAARRLENSLVYQQLTTNPTMSDSTALFHSDHGNLAASGAAIGLTTLGAGRSAMRVQKGLADEPLNITPAYLIVPTAQEQLAYQYTSAMYTPTKSTDINEFRSGGRTSLTPVVEPILDAASSTAWYLAGDGVACDTVEYCWLDGAEGVYLESDLAFDHDGMRIKARLDFASKVIDWRALYKNAGA